LEPTEVGVLLEIHKAQEVQTENYV
jgi:hypothetical protein